MLIVRTYGEEELLEERKVEIAPPLIATIIGKGVDDGESHELNETEAVSLVGPLPKGRHVLEQDGDR